MKRNVSVLGFIIGLLLPLLGIYIVYLVKFGGETLASFFQLLVHNTDVAASVLSLSVLVNIIPFIYYTNRRLDLTARGILISTLLYGVVFILLKFVW
jgi:hypothetical protein